MHVHVRGAVRLCYWQCATLNKVTPFLVFAPRLRITSCRTLVALCTMCLRWCREWEASHSLPLADMQSFQIPLYYCILFDF